MLDLTRMARGSLLFRPPETTSHGSPRLAYRQAQSEQADELVSPPGAVILGWRNHPTYDALAECWEHRRDVILVRGFRVAAVLRHASGSRRAQTNLRRAQYAMSDDQRLDLARSLVDAKVRNQRSLLLGLARRSPQEVIAQQARRLAADRHAIASKSDFDSLRGIEGICARQYFLALATHAQLTDWHRRPREWVDPLNLLLDCCYARLVQALAVCLLDLGADLACGALHQHDDRRPTLALDLMEPLRPLIADRLALRLLRNTGGSWWEPDPARTDRLRLTVNGRRGLADAWDHWYQGSPGRPGMHEQVQQSVHQWHRWQQDASYALDWPRLA